MRWLEAHLGVDVQHGGVALGVAGAQCGHFGGVGAQPPPHSGLHPAADAAAPQGGQHNGVPLPREGRAKPVDEHFRGTRGRPVGADGQDAQVIDAAGVAGCEVGSQRGGVKGHVLDVEVVGGGLVHSVGGSN